MKKYFYFIIPTLLIIGAVFAGYGFLQAQLEKDRNHDDIQKRVESLADSLDTYVRQVVLAKDVNSAKYLVDKFKNRKRLQGSAIYDADGNVMAVTETYSRFITKKQGFIDDAFRNGQSAGKFDRLGLQLVYRYALPIRSGEKTVGMLEIIYDTGYVNERINELWRNIALAYLVIALTLILISFFILQRYFVKPVEQLTDWFKKFQKGETGTKHNISGSGEITKLADEVEQVALKLKVARSSISRTASERLKREDIWTEGKLRDLLHAKIGEKAFFVVSNREPYIHSYDEKTGEVISTRPASGVVTAIDPILKACGGTWIAHGSGSADRKVVNSNDQIGVPPENPRYILKRVWLTKEEEQGYYYGFSNEGLWPLCHITHTRPEFNEEDWKYYVEVNRKFADAVVADMPAGQTFVFVQDYHFALLPKMIKEKRPDAVVALFWHIPWPNPEIFSICPYQKELLEGMLGSDVIGFHVQFHCNNFLDTVNRTLESRVDFERFSVTRSGCETLVKPFPISVALPSADTAAQEDASQLRKLEKEIDLSGKALILGVERIDYTKGLVERIRSIGYFLEKNPEYKKKFVYVQIAAPSRTHIKRYMDLDHEIDRMVDMVNWKYSDHDWKPIVYLKRHFSPEEILPFYKAADICIVSSLHDGMNLVAKEFIVAKDGDPGALILSKFAGASKELTQAIQMNPYSIEEFAGSLKTAIDMPEEEKASRMSELLAVIEVNNVFKWAADIINELTSLDKCHEVKPK